MKVGSSRLGPIRTAERWDGSRLLRTASETPDKPSVAPEIHSDIAAPRSDELKRLSIVLCEEIPHENDAAIRMSSDDAVRLRLVRLVSGDRRIGFRQCAFPSAEPWRCRKYRQREAGVSGKRLRCAHDRVIAP